MFDFFGGRAVENIEGDEIQVEKSEKPEEPEKVDDYFLPDPEKSTLYMLRKDLYGMQDSDRVAMF